MVYLGSKFRFKCMTTWPTILRGMGGLSFPSSSCIRRDLLQHQPPIADEDLERAVMEATRSTPSDGRLIYYTCNCFRFLFLKSTEVCSLECFTVSLFPPNFQPLSFFFFERSGIWLKRVFNLSIFVLCVVIFFPTWTHWERLTSLLVVRCIDIYNTLFLLQNSKQHIKLYIPYSNSTFIMNILLLEEFKSTIYF